MNSGFLFESIQLFWVPSFPYLQIELHFPRLEVRPLIPYGTDAMDLELVLKSLISVEVVVDISPQQLVRVAADRI